MEGYRPTQRSFLLVSRPSQTGWLAWVSVFMRLSLWSILDRNLKQEEPFNTTEHHRLHITVDIADSDAAIGSSML